MGAVAGRTRRLKFGHSVMVLPGRNPVLLAKELATIDVLSGGRLVAAFGLGVEDAREQRVFAVERKEAGGRTAEAVALMKRLWTEDGVDHQGRYFRVEGLSLRPRPVQRPHPDVWFGGYSPAALRRVATIGEGWLPSFIGPEEYRGMAATIRELAGAAGRKIDDEHFGALVPYLPPGAASPEPILAAIAARRPGIDPRKLIVCEPDGGLGRQIEAFIAAGASKFVVVPVLAPSDWSEELERLFAGVVRPLEGSR